MTDASLPETMKHALAAWGAAQPNVRRAVVFGSRAKGTARPDSDLDLAVDLMPSLSSPLADLIAHRGTWRDELTRLLGVTVKDIYLADDPVAKAAIADHGVVVFERPER